MKMFPPNSGHALKVPRFMTVTPKVVPLEGSHVPMVPNANGVTYNGYRALKVSRDTAVTR